MVTAPESHGQDSASQPAQTSSITLAVGQGAGVGWMS
jgi:hypothetical protein